MATLNIKSFPDALYRRLQARARRQRRSLAQEVIQILGEALGKPQPLSILKLRGLGKEQWVAIDPAVHVARERAMWD